MDTARWKIVREIYHSVLDRAPDDQQHQLEAACDGDGLLLAEVRSLLAVDARAGSFLDEPPSSVINLFQGSTSDAAPGARLGGYTIRGVLGRGGTAVVYEADQENPRRAVALKVVRPLPLDELTPRLVQREVAALARLEHPAIGAIYAAGVDDGRHYIAMEIVRGAPITRHVREARINVNSRLRLFQAVCEAVHYAHQRGVIHRDLKPSNILVSATGQPKVLDFGVARIFGSADGASITLTEGALVGSLAYMSPEQMQGPIATVDTRSDVYALGVILYELLCDQPPYEVQGLALASAARVVCEKAPAPPRLSDPGLRGDLEAILYKALEKDPRRRYQSPAELADDIDRHFRQLPLRAHPAGALYSARKFIARHRIPMIAAGCILVVTALGVAGTVWQSIRAAQSESHARELATREMEARRAADKEAEISSRINSFLQLLLTARSKDQGPGEKFTLREALDAAADRIDVQFADFPAVRADMHATVASAYQDLGFAAAALRHNQACLEQRESLLGPDNVELFPVLCEIATHMVRSARYAEAQTTLERARAIALREFGENSLQMMRLLNTRGLLLNHEGDAIGAEQHFRRAITICTSLGNYPDRLAVQHVNLGLALMQQRRLAEAEQSIRRGLELMTTADRPPQPAADTNARNNLVVVLLAQDKFAEALPLLEDVLNRQIKAVGESTPRVAATLARIASCQHKLGDSASAVVNADRARESLKNRSSQPRHDSVSAAHRVAAVFRDLGRDGDAETIYREALEQAARRGPSATHQFLQLEQFLCELLFQTNRQDEALERLTAALAAAEQAGISHWRVAATRRQLGDCMWRGGGDPATAEDYMRGALDSLQSALGDTHTATQAAFRTLIAFYEATGREGEAAILRPRLQDKSRAEPALDGE